MATVQSIMASSHVLQAQMLPMKPAGGLTSSEVRSSLTSLSSHPRLHPFAASSRANVRTRRRSAPPGLATCSLPHLTDSNILINASSTHFHTSFDPLHAISTIASASPSSASTAVDSALELSNWSMAVGVGLPCTLMDCGDVYHRSTLNQDDSLKLTIGGILLLTIVGGYLWATPGVAPGFFDMFVLAPLERYLRPKYGKGDIALGRKLGEGAFGSAYRAEFADKNGKQLVVKRANEFGAVETWMNERVRRACPDACASFVTGFQEKNKGKEDFWLVWEFEGDSTFSKVMEAKDFPYNVEEAVLGRVPGGPRTPQREMRIIRKLFGKILSSLQKLHSVGIVHRDIKPQNMIFNSETGALKIIDLGAATDLRVGINYKPNEFLLDPRYAAPELYIMSTQTPKAPPPPVAAALSPVLWQMNLPDRFDMYSAGLIFMQMCFPNLRTDNGLIAFNRQLKRCDYDLAKWREAAEKRGTPELLKGLELMDMNGGLGWQLVQAMMRSKGRQRISANVALLHPFFDPFAPTVLQRVRLAVLRLVYRDNAEVSKAFIDFIAKGPDSTGGFTELDLQKFRREERKKGKDTVDRNAAAFAIKLQRKMNKTINSTFGGQEDDSKSDAWWNRWQAKSSADSKAL